MTAERGTAYRFTLDDEHAIAARIADTLNTWTGLTAPAVRPVDAASLDALYRVGCHAIGCSDADLRDVEAEWIRTHVAHAVALAEVGR